MSITIRCPRCGKPSAADDDAAGDRVSCPHCGALVAVPVPGAGIKTSRGTVYNPTVAGAAKEQRQRQRWAEAGVAPRTSSGLGKTIAIIVAVFFVIGSTLVGIKGGSKRSGGSSFGERKAQAGDLYGSWTHQGSNLTVDIKFNNDGSYERWPKGYELVGAGIGEIGKWHIDGDNCLIFNPTGGSFYPSIRGNRLTLKHQMNGTSYIFTRKS